MKLYSYYKLLVLGTIYIGVHFYAAYHVWKIAAPGPALWLASLALPMVVLVLLIPWAIRVERSQLLRRREEAGEPTQGSDNDRWWRPGR